jgi:flagellar motor switch protein FliN/FliY
MTRFIDCWVSVATVLFSQALSGEPELVELRAEPMAHGAFGFVATLIGDEEGQFSVMLDPALLAASLTGDGIDQKAGWSELLREVAESAAGELLAKTGKKCRVEKIEELTGQCDAPARGFQLKSSGGVWSLRVHDELKTQEAKKQEADAQPPLSSPSPGPAPDSAVPQLSAGLSPGIELLLDVELEAALRFGCREMPLGEILDMGPGDVVELDRQVTDPVDLIVGDKIVARGEVVLVNGNFGLRVTEVAAPRKRLESIRCLF